MSNGTVGHRRLDLRSALTATVRALSRLWVSAGGALALCAFVWLAPLGVGLTGWSHIVWVTAAGLASLISVGALARLSITDDAASARTLGLGPAGLQVGKPELRLFGAGLLCLIFLAMILIVLALVVLAVFGTADLDLAAIQARDWSRVGAPWKLGLLVALGTIALAVPLLLAARLSLFVPATVGRRQMVSLNSMALTRGSVWPLLAGLIVTAAPKIAMLTLFGTGLMRGTVAEAAWTVVMIGLQLPLTFGFLGAVYRQLEDWTPVEPKA